MRLQFDGKAWLEAEACFRRVQQRSCPHIRQQGLWVLRASKRVASPPAGAFAGGHSKESVLRVLMRLNGALPHYLYHTSFKKHSAGHLGVNVLSSMWTARAKVVRGGFSERPLRILISTRPAVPKGSFGSCLGLYMQTCTASRKRRRKGAAFVELAHVNSGGTGLQHEPCVSQSTLGLCLQHSTWFFHHVNPAASYVMATTTL